MTKASNPTVSNKLSLLENIVLEHAKNGQPVLFYGEDKCNEREDLIKRIHLLNGGIDSGWEYRGCSKDFKDLHTVFDEVKNSIGISDYDSIKQILKEHKVTAKTYECFDFSSYYESENSFIRLTRNVYYENIEKVVDSVKQNVKYQSIGYLDIEETNNGMYWWSALLFRNGLLFINNLRCVSTNDTQIFTRLAPRIEERRTKDSTLGNWLVAYIFDPGVLPRQFRKQFVEIPLEAGALVIEVYRDSKLLRCKSTGKEAKLEPRQVQLLQLLHNNKDKLVTRDKIHNNLWGDQPVYDQQITDHMSLLIGAFVKLGLEREFVKGEIIETISKSRVSLGGYKFHSHAISLHFH